MKYKNISLTRWVATVPRDDPRTADSRYIVGAPPPDWERTSGELLEAGMVGIYLPEEKA